MSDWDDWTNKANDDDLLDYSIRQEKKNPPGNSVGCGGFGCIVVLALLGLAMLGGIVKIILEIVF